VSTVKRLYAHAFRCANPDCSRPLYTQNNDTGDLVLNSRVAHIHARQPGGPRWIEMPEEDNRADANLVLLCIEHSYEIDEFPDSFPADLLRDWKQAQLDEYGRAQRSWPLSDADAGRVLEASSRAIEHHHAGAVLGVVRTAQRLALATPKARRGPAARAADWRTARARARRAFTGWDEDGNSVYAEPSRHETEQLRAALIAALVEACEILTPLTEDVKVELAAVEATRPAIKPWSGWVSRAVEEVVAASSTWPSPPGLEDDGRLDAAVSGLAAATEALTAAWRDESAAPSPPPLAPEPGPTPVRRDLLREHRELLERARPYTRVDHRPYDAALRADLAAAAERAATIPPVPTALGVGLSATCGLAAAVAANADDHELATLMEQDAQRRPISAAVVLLEETARVAEKRGRLTVQDQAKAVLAGLWDSIDWSDPDMWDDEDKNLHVAPWAGSRVTSPEEVKERLSNAVTLRPEIVPDLVKACAGWEERRDSYDWSMRGFQRRYSALPPWFPIESVVAAIPSIAPSAASVAMDAFGETVKDDTESLLAQVLHLAEQPRLDADRAT
jgi:hypothetical protein